MNRPLKMKPPRVRKGGRGTSMHCTVTGHCHACIAVKFCTLVFGVLVLVIRLETILIVSESSELKSLFRVEENDTFFMF